MLDICVGLLLVWAAMALARDTSVGRWLRHLLIEAPAARLARITREHVVIATVLFGGTAVIVAVLGHEAARVLAMGLPELATWMTMVEVTAYIDAAVAVVSTLAVTRFAGLKAWLRTIPLPGRPHNRARRQQRTAHAVRKPANDDEPGWALAA